MLLLLWSVWDDNASVLDLGIDLIDGPVWLGIQSIEKSLIRCSWIPHFQSAQICKPSRHVGRVDCIVRIVESLNGIEDVNHTLELGLV